MAVAHATRRAGASLRGQFKLGGCNKHGVLVALKEVVKVDARKNREPAMQADWEAHWNGTSTADEIAKLARPRLQCKEKEQQSVISGIRAQRARIEGCCKNLEGL